MTEIEQASPPSVEAIAARAENPAALEIVNHTLNTIKRLHETPVINGTTQQTPPEDLNLIPEFSVAIDTKGIMKTIVNLN